MKTFSNPQELLDHIQTQERNAFYDKQPNETYASELNKQAESVGLNTTENSGVEHALEDLATRLLISLPEELRLSIEGSVAIGVLHHQDVNAQIIRSDEGYYAITLNSGLMMLLNKFTKLLAASRAPEAVKYINRGPVPSYTGEDYLKMIGEMMRHYAETGLPLGPQLMIDYRHPINLVRGMMLLDIEMFILAHELGHFGNGDLDSNASFAKWKYDGELSVVEMYRNHEMEFAADAFAFECVCRMESTTSPEADAISLLFRTAIPTFDFLADISDRDSYTHPGPIRRLLSITSRFYGEGVAGLLEESYKDPSVIEKLPTIWKATTLKDFAETSGLH